MFKIQNYKYMVYKHILNIEETTYVSNFKIIIFYFVSTLLYKYIHHIIFKSNLVLKSTLLVVILKMIFLLVNFRHLFNLT